MDAGNAEAYIHVLQCLRGTVARIYAEGFGKRCYDKQGGCAADSFTEWYLNAMDEAIRCIKIVNGLEDPGADEKEA